jgi:hypothetical protein
MESKREVETKRMEFPDDVLRHIREYAVPIGLRLDWRKCKRNESRRIKQSNLALLLWYRWFLGEGGLFPEVDSWTFYGRRHLLSESRQRYWTHVYGIPKEQDPEYYEKRFMLRIHPILHSPGPLEYHMSQVSLIV